MKCLSLKQPYAELLVSGKKTIELRTWNTKFRGEFLVHASKKVDLDACVRMKIDPNSFVTGAVVGMATLYDVKVYDNTSSFLKDKNKHYSKAILGDHKYGFLVNHAQKFRKPFILSGKLGFFNVEWKKQI
jgi:predicted transcriptional regulator